MQNEGKAVWGTTESKPITNLPKGSWAIREMVEWKSSKVGPGFHKGQTDLRLWCPGERGQTWSHSIFSLPLLKSGKIAVEG